MNFLQGQIVSASSEGGIIQLSGGALLSAAVDAGQLKTGDPVTVGIRRDDVTLDNGEANRLPVRLRHVEHTGDATVLYTDMDGITDPFVVRRPGSFSADRGSTLFLRVKNTACRVFDSEGIALRRTPDRCAQTSST